MEWATEIISDDSDFDKIKEIKRVPLEDIKRIKLEKFSKGKKNNK